MASPNEVEKYRKGWTGEQRNAVTAKLSHKAEKDYFKYLMLEKEFLLYPGVFNPEIKPQISQFIIGSFFELATEEASKKGPQQGLVDFLEVCGAGHTAISVALLSDKCHVWATDINEAAVKNARANAKLHGVENRVRVALTNVFEHDEITARRFDMIY